MAGQFDTYDNQSDRRAIMDLLARLDEGVEYPKGNERRGAFLQGLLRSKARTFEGAPFQVSPCSAVEAYHLFVAITGVIGVPIGEAAKALEQHVRRVCP